MMVVGLAEMMKLDVDDSLLSFRSEFQLHGGLSSYGSELIGHWPSLELPPQLAPVFMEGLDVVWMKADIARPGRCPGP